MLLGISELGSVDASTARQQELTGKSVWNKEDRQGNVVFCTGHVEIL
jgi:hypothetical protein